MVMTLLLEVAKFQVVRILRLVMRSRLKVEVLVELLVVVNLD